MSTYFTHSDGLTQRYGTVDSENKGRKTNTNNVVQELVLKIVGTELGDAASNAHLVGAASIPAGAHILSASLEVTTIFTSGGAATMDIGVYKSLDLSIVDEDGIDADIALTAIDAVGDTIACDGAVINTNLVNDSLIAASYETAAFTAGEATLIVSYLIP